MAATADKYSHETLNDKDTTSGQTTTKNIYALQPLALEEYVNDATFKKVFWCHDVWHKKDGEDNEVAIGLLKTSVSQAEGFPATICSELHGGCSSTAAIAASDPHNRKGKLHLVKGGADYIVLNDGGLNTKPWADTCSPGLDPSTGLPLPTVINASDLGLTFAMNYLNAWYLNTTIIQVEVQVCNQAGTTAVSSRTFTVPGITTTKKYDEYSYDGDPYIVTIESVNSYGDFVKNAYFKLRLLATNDEGTYTSPWSSVFQVGDHPAVWPVYKINSLNQDPTTGTRYDIILVGGYSGTGDPASPFIPHGYYRAADSSVSPSAPSGTGYQEFDYPTLYNLIGGVPYQWQSGGAQGIVAAVAAGTTRTVSFAINGARYGSSDDIFTSILPEGMYAHFPTVFPYERGQENVPEDICTYIPRQNSSSTKIKPIVYVNSSGVPYMWNASEHVDPTPTVTAEITAVTCAIVTNSSDDWYGYVNNENGIISFGVKPKVTITGKGNVSIPIIVEWYDENEHDVVIGSSGILTASLQLGATSRTVTIGVSTDEEVHANQFPMVEATFNAPQTASTGDYKVKFRIITDGAYAIDPTPTATGDWDESNEWNLSAAPK